MSKELNATTLKVGQTLLLVRSDNARSRLAVKVEKIGREWVSLDRRDMRIALTDPDWSVLDRNNSFVGRCYLSLEAYDSSRLLFAEWMELVRGIGNTRMLPKGMTLEKIAKIRELVEGA